MGDTTRIAASPLVAGPDHGRQSCSRAQAASSSRTRWAGALLGDDDIVEVGVLVLRGRTSRTGPAEESAENESVNAESGPVAAPPLSGFEKRTTDVPVRQVAFRAGEGCNRQFNAWLSLCAVVPNRRRRGQRPQEDGRLVRPARSGSASPLEGSQGLMGMRRRAREALYACGGGEPGVGLVYRASERYLKPWGTNVMRVPLRTRCA